MNAKHLIVPVIIIILFASCNKAFESTSPVAADSYQNSTAGSSWDYRQTDSSGSIPIYSVYTVTATSIDTSINGRSYHVFANTISGSEYLGVFGNDYYQYTSLPSGFSSDIFEILYLKNNLTVGQNWTQNFSLTVSGSPIPIPVTITNTIMETGISRKVVNNTYTNVIHVSTKLTSPLIPAASLTSSIDSYYAPNYGLIENTTGVNLDYSGITENVAMQTLLVDATLK